MFRYGRGIIMKILINAEYNKKRRDIKDLLTL